MIRVENSSGSQVFIDINERQEKDIFYCLLNEPAAHNKFVSKEFSFGKEYVCFIKENGQRSYAFPLSAGNSYVYRGEGRLWNVNLNCEVRFNVPEKSGSIGFYENSQWGDHNICLVYPNGEGELAEVPLNDSVYFAGPPGKYLVHVFTSSNKSQNTDFNFTNVFEVELGKSYYIYGSGNWFIDCRTNLAMEPLKQKFSKPTLRSRNQISNIRKGTRIVKFFELIQDGNITFSNGTYSEINVSIHKDEGAAAQNSDYWPLKPRQSEKWGRCFNKEYLCFVVDPDAYSYSFLLRGGSSYTYQGQGVLFNNSLGRVIESEEYNISAPGNIVVKAFGCNVVISLTGGGDVSYTIHDRQYLRFIRRDGNYLLRFTDSKGQQRRYVLTTGRCYYIYNSGLLIDIGSRYVLPIYSEDSNAVVSFGCDYLNSIYRTSGRSHSWQSWSSSYSSVTKYSYSSNIITEFFKFSEEQRIQQGGTNVRMNVNVEDFGGLGLVSSGKVVKY